MNYNNPGCRQQDGCALNFPAFALPWLRHGVFNRHGGVSPVPWASSNVTYGLGDRRENVLANRQRIKNLLGLRRLVSARQVHGSRVYTLTENLQEDIEVDGFDGLVTNVLDTGLMVQQADCQAVLLADPVRRAVGIAHAGWRGTVAGILGETIYAMCRAFASEPPDLLAAISPSLGPCCAEFVNFRTELPGPLHGYQVRETHFDFWAISRDQLRRAGVRPENIHTASICTRCSRDYFSYRREKQTGRFGSVIGMKNA